MTGAPEKRKTSTIHKAFGEAGITSPGKPAAFAFITALGVAVWAATGPIFHYSDTWQLVIDTGTTGWFLFNGVPYSKLPKPEMVPAMLTSQAR